MCCNRTAVTDSCALQKLHVENSLSMTVDSSVHVRVHSLPMVTKNHKHSMSTQERSFWKDVFIKALIVPSNGEKHFPDDAARDAADYANAAVLEYRKTVTWRQS